MTEPEKVETLDADPRSAGLYDKYVVHRVVSHDDQGGVAEVKLVTDRVFVLNPRTDPLARVVLAQYAVEARHAGYQQLGDDIVKWLQEVPRSES